MPYYDTVTRLTLPLVLKRIQAAIHEPVADLSVILYRTAEPVPYAERLSGEKREIRVGESWGTLWDCAWFLFSGTVPESARGRKVDLLIDVSGEACIVGRSGEPLRGLTTVSSEYDFTLGRPGKTVFPFADPARGGEKIELWADCGCNDLFGKYQDSGVLKQARVAVRNEEMRKLFYDFEVLLELLDHVPPTRARHRGILLALRAAESCLFSFTESEARRARAALAPELARQGGDPSLSVSAIGHAHIDLGWLWPIRETIRKGARSFSTVLANMEAYPDYVFGASQAQLYLWMKEMHPSLFQRIKSRIQEDRWEIQGGMWVEPDTNVTGGESLVRQFLYGKRFFQQEFGKDMRILWLPDAFGYSGALPQIMRQCGVDYFMTIKLSWNIFNRFPHHSFRWKGIDGSTVLAHMAPEGTYNSSAAPRALAKAESEFLDKGVSDRCLLIFGIGDGGGGPGEEHLERLARERNLEGLAPVRQEPAIRFFDALARDAERLETWRGELYLERHQGTYTTQARSKRANRKIEFALRELELSAAWAAVEKNFAYPREELLALWREVLLYQFHDILPGSSIARVYDESLARYTAISEKVRGLTASARSALLGKGNTEYIFNPLSWERTEWVKTCSGWTLVTVPALGFASLEPQAVPAQISGLRHGPDVMENDALIIRFDPSSGAVVSVFDKGARRETLAPSAPANVLAVYEDVGDAWDIHIGYRDRPAEQFALVSASTIVDGPHVARACEYSYRSSKLLQRVVLTAGSRRIDFETTVDWQERGRMLRTSFPVAVETDHATFDIQFGCIERPTVKNTSWDMARFEVCAHKWADLSQGDRGVALLNDCKYGHTVEGNVLDLNLLRSTSHPDPVADAGTHQFTYSLFPHPGDLRSGGVVRAGYELNAPLSCVMGSIGSEARSFLRLEGTEAGSIVVEAVKLAEDSNDVVVRLYESQGRGAKALLVAGFPFREAQEANMLEEASGALELSGDGIALEFGPFQIRTVIVRP
ncbi:MAG: alpha-mannosidase [Spirochaetia bacterium]|jgi:alpha-mannosidase